MGQRLGWVGVRYQRPRDVARARKGGVGKERKKRKVWWEMWSRDPQGELRVGKCAAPEL